jgi:hypothetical protein
MSTPSLDDRLAITDLTVAYCWALDTRNWEELDRVFLPDAAAELGLPAVQGIDAIKATVSRVLTPLDDSQHIVANHQIAVDGDRATCRCYFHAQHIRRGVPGGENFVVAGRYEDDLVRTAAGWRIAQRTLVVMWREGNLAVVRPPQTH